MNFNLAVILQETALAFPDRPAVVYAGGQLSYAELDTLSSRLAAGLERLAACKHPRRFEFRAQMPKNSLGKILKDELPPPGPVTSTAASSRPRAAAGKDRPWSA